MIQLGYYPTAQQSQDESMDFDPNYDPSDFLMKKDSEEPAPIIQQQQQTQQLQQYQENYDYSSVAAGAIQEGAGGDEIQTNYYGGFNQPAFNVSGGEFSAYQQSAQDDFMQQPQQQQQLLPADGSVLADLEISDSDDEEDQNESNENPAETSKDDDGLWF